MNAEEAKVPAVEGHWQSIEIFLFSNGQRYTPPRKYHLRADELNLWDYTLNLLSQSHYGLQIPLINLYTTDGQLVEGPLELKDGMAYVAVTPPDTFIDAGYQKYLIRASRSWEKRQARKKIPECVTEDQCCLCPEKEWCCDLQTCCLCPEKKDEDSVESLYCATGHPELAPADGHFMSSAPLKPAAADDYRPRTGKIAATAGEHAIRPGEHAVRPGEHAVRPGEYGASPGEFKYSPVESPARPGEYGASPGEFKYSPVESLAKPNKYGAGLVKHEANPSEHVLRLSENGSRLGEFRAGPDEFGATSGEFGPRLNENVPIVSKNGVRPVEYGTRLNEYGVRPGEYVVSLSENEPRLSKDGARLTEYDNKPRENSAIPCEYKTRLSINGSKPSECGINSGKYETRSSINGARPSINAARPGEYEAKPSEQGAQPGKYKTKQSINGDMPSEYRVRPGEYETRPTVIEAQTSEYKARSVENETRPSINGVKPNEYGAKPAEYETRSTVNGAKPSEYKARQCENVAKPSEYKARLGENGAMPDEYKARPVQNETRSSINEVKPNEYGAKPAEYEIKPGVNGVKPREYETRPGEYETGPTASEAKPGEYETKPSINGAKPGEYRARSEEFADRSAEQRTRPDEYRGVHMSKGGAWYDEDGSRPTVYEAILGHDEPCSNEIESKKKAYEIRLRDNERSLDDNVDRQGEDTVDKDAREECKFRKQSSTLSPIGESELETKTEYGITESDQRDKQIDPKGRASGNAERGGTRRVSGGNQSGRENDTVNGINEPKAIEIKNARKTSKLRPSGIENKRRPSQQRKEIERTRRLNRQAGAEIEQGGRTGELTREFEPGGKVSEQKDREPNPAGRAGVNAARLSEQRNKQSYHLARLGGRESRVGDHDARAGDLGLRTSNHDAGLVNPGSSVADTGARAAVSGSRASPKDGISSIVRTSNLGQPKLGTPGTRVDETTAKAGESEIKNRVGYPGARQSNVGGIGVAGASHISETRQHARRTSLIAERALTEKKRLSIGQNSSLLRKPTPNSSVLHKSEDKQPIKTNKEILLKKINGKASAIPVPASNDVGQSKTLPKDPYKPITPPALPPPTSITNLVNLATNIAPLANITDEKEITVVSTHLFREPESEIRSMRFDSVKQLVDINKNSPEETQTELIYVQKSMASVTVNEGVQTNTEPAEQHRQEVSASSKVKVNSCACTCTLCCKRDHRLATVDPDENIISIQNKGDVINLKLNIKVRKIVRSVYSSQRNFVRSQSLTNIPRSEKESQISIEHGMTMQRKSSLQLNHQDFRGYGFEGSPKAMVVQCADCGRLNYPPRCDQPPCCDNNKNYFVLLASSLNEDMDDCCNLNPPCRPCDLTQSQLKKTSSNFPLKQTLSDMTLDTITTVTVSGVPLQRREMVKKTVMACQTEEPQGECKMTKRKVSISQDSGARCDVQKESNSSISVSRQVDNVKTKHSCKKLCPQKWEHEDSQVCSEFCLPVTSCQKVRSICSQVSSEACPCVQSKECRQTSLQVQSHGCMPVSPTCSPCCPKPLPCIHVQTQVCSQVPQVSDAQTQTQWNSIVLQARLHPDGRYSFHLPSLNVLNSYPF